MECWENSEAGTVRIDTVRSTVEEVVITGLMSCGSSVYGDCYLQVYSTVIDRSPESLRNSDSKLNQMEQKIAVRSRSVHETKGERLWLKNF